MCDSKKEIIRSYKKELKKIIKKAKRTIAKLDEALELNTIEEYLKDLRVMAFKEKIEHLEKGFKITKKL